MDHVEGTGRVLAVLDWELCTLGDPLADLGLVLAYRSPTSEQNRSIGLAGHSLSSFVHLAEILEEL
jgi:aminoglycoside phosphotransferase (APT) family kinase protein